MPAVELTRLRAQISQLFELVNRPEAFHQSLKALLDRYAEHAYRPGKDITSRPVLDTYRVPPLVSRQLEVELHAACERRPDDMLRVADALWQDDYLEPRLIAAITLGLLPASHSEAVTERLRAWMKPDEDSQVLAFLLERGAAGLRERDPGALLALLQTWLESRDADTLKYGLRFIETIVADPAFENIPAIFRLLSPLLHAPSVQMLNDLQGCLTALAQRTQPETAFFLRQVLSTTTTEVTARLIRRLLPEFSPEIQAGLRTALRTRAAR